MGTTIRDVAREAGVSVTAASATLNGTRGSTIRVGSATKERIFAAAANIGYVSNPLAKSLATGRTKVLGLMLPYSDAFIDQNPFCHEVVAGIMREVVRQQYNLMLYTATSGVPLEQASMLVDSRIDGLLLVLPPEHATIYAKCKRLAIPYVSVLKRPVGDEWVVNSDDYAGGRLVAEHFLSLGHTRLGHLCGPDDIPSSLPRRQGFRDAILDAGLPLNEDWFVPAGMDWRVGQAGMERLLANGVSDAPTAVFAVNDLCAEGAIRALRAAGLSAPTDVAVVGYDDTWYATLTQPPLTTIRMPIQEMGEIAARMLIRRIEHPLDALTSFQTQPVLPVSLTIRESCGSNSRPISQGTSKLPSRQ